MSPLLNITPLLNAFAEYQGIHDAEEALDQFKDNYAGTFDSAEAWAESLLDETGELAEIPERFRHYFDFERYARDCELNGDIWTMETNAGTAVFGNR